MCPYVMAEKQPIDNIIDMQMYGNPAIIDRSVECTTDRAQSAIGQKNRKYSVSFTRGHGDKGKVKKKNYNKRFDRRVFSPATGVHVFFPAKGCFPRSLLKLSF